MLRNYITVALRNLAANRLHSLINIGGLAVGLAACLLILLYVRDELGYDRWIPNADRIAAVETTFFIPGRETLQVAAAPGLVKPALENDFSSDVERAVRVYKAEAPMRAGDRQFLTKVTYVDPGYFEVFDLPMVAGQREAVLANNASILLSRSTAEKYFGDGSALGKTVTVGDKLVFTVIGVFADIPHNSHLELHAIALLDLPRYKEQPWVAESWTSANTAIYALMRSREAIASVQADLPAFVDRNVHFDIPGLVEKPSTLLRLDLMPVPDIHLHADKPGYLNTGSYRQVLAFLGIAFLILLIACINFVNLATARAMTRAREVALRKVVGATRGQLVRQHLGEAIITALLALGVALGLVGLVLGVFNAFLHKELRLEVFGDPVLLVTMVALIALVGVAGGLYPAFVLSRFRPAMVLKANQSSANGSSRLRSGLVVVQFAVSISLIICTTIVYAQTVYARSLDLGFATRDRLALQGISDVPEPVHAALKRELATLPGVRGVALSSDVPPLQSSSNALLFPSAAPGETKYIVETIRVDPDFFTVYDIRPLGGRLFSLDHPGDFEPLPGDTNPDPKHGVVVNLSMVHKLGAARPEDVVGKVLWSANERDKPMIVTTIVGVVPDLYLRSAREVMTPMLFLVNHPERLGRMTLAVDPERAQDVATAAETVWKRLALAVPFRSSWVDQDLAKQYDREQKFGEIVAGFAAFAIFIACLGLFGLASFAAQRRTKEIGLRKVLGASVLDIVRLLVWQFSRPVLVGCVIAWPIAYYLMDRWLGSFQRAISLTDPRVIGGVFGGATLLAVGIAWLTTAGHAFRVARANPGRALRVE
jgi:putative ABC transport system permease protein